MATKSETVMDIIAERDELRAENEALQIRLRAARRLLVECSAFMAAFGEDVCAESADLRQACELECALDAALAAGRKE